VTPAVTFRQKWAPAPVWPGRAALWIGYGGGGVRPCRRLGFSPGAGVRPATAGARRGRRAGRRWAASAACASVSGRVISSSFFHSLDI